MKPRSGISVVASFAGWAFAMTTTTCAAEPQRVRSGVSPARVNGQFKVEERPDRLLIGLADQPVAEFVFKDSRILRPYFAQVRTPGGLQVTRNHPPVERVDATDHDTMHPGIWLGFGDISGSDFWRNKGRIEHLRFTKPPTTTLDRLTFATESELRTPEGKRLCLLASRFTLAVQPSGWMLLWDATFRSAETAFVFGDQEEMGFGARVATPLAEKHGGFITSSAGRTTAKETWGHPASWCDYSGRIGKQVAGITLLAAPHNFRESWWHNRDYGVVVANPFGRAAMKQGDPSAIRIQPGEPFHICFAASIHEGPGYNPADALAQFVSLVQDNIAGSKP